MNMVDMDKIKTFAVIGAGTMEREIAQVALMSNSFEEVILNDINAEVLEKATEFIEAGLKKIESKGKLGQELSTHALMEKLTKELDLTRAVVDADFVVEAIPEIMELKKQIFEKLGKYAPEHAILATNTSTMNISDIASTSGRPDKVIGMHFFTPIPILRLIEIIKGKKTSNTTMEITMAIGRKLPALKGKRFLARIEKESPGFIVNRLIIGSSLYLSWLLDHAMEKGIPIEQIDADVGGLQELGPYAKWDYLGLDIVYHALSYFSETLSPDFTPGKTLTKLVNEGNLGKKTGKGIYEWVNDKPKLNTKKKAGLFNFEMFYAVQLNEGCRLLEEGIVSGYKVIDETMLAGMDMPGPFGAGKKKYIEWSKLLEDFIERSGLHYLKPCKLMKSGAFVKMRK